MTDIAWPENALEVRNLLRDPKITARNPISCVGATQSGKSKAAVWFGLSWLAYNWSGYNACLSARSDAQFNEVFMEHMNEFCEVNDFRLRRRTSFWEMDSAYGEAPNRLHRRIGAHIGSIDRMMGPRYVLVIIDEVYRQPAEYVSAFSTRASVRGCKIIHTGNVEGPSHPYETKFVKSNLAHVIRFGQLDNPTLPDDYYETMKAQLPDYMYKRLALGIPTATEGAVYANASLALTPDLTDDELEDCYYTASADWGYSAPTHFILWANWPGQRKAVAVDEWVHNGAQQGQLSDSEQADRIHEMLAGRHVLNAVIDDGGESPRGASAVGLIDELNKRGIPSFPVEKGPGSVQAAIVKTRARIQDGSLKVTSRCEHTYTALTNHRYDELHGIVGDRVPARDEFKHGCDAVQYRVQTDDLGVKPPVVVRRQHDPDRRDQLRRIPGRR